MTYPGPVSPNYSYTMSSKIFRFALESYDACIRDKSQIKPSNQGCNITEYALLVFITSAAATITYLEENLQSFRATIYRL